jgi:hypothetical protein
MTSHFIARVVESLYNKIDIDEINKEFEGIEKYNESGRVNDKWVNKSIENKTYIRWVKSITLLEQHLRMNYHSFEETELVYKWAKDICERRRKNLNQYRAYGNPFGLRTFKEWLTKH